LCFLCFVCLRHFLVCLVLPASQDCSFSIALSVFSNIYFNKTRTKKQDFYLLIVSYIFCIRVYRRNSDMSYIKEWMSSINCNPSCNKL
jgi:hypothetical protein